MHIHIDRSQLGGHWGDIGSPIPPETDPAVLAYAAWRMAYEEFESSQADTDTAEGLALYEAELDARVAIAKATPTSRAGLIAKLKFAPYAFGTPHSDGAMDDAESYTFEVWGGEIERAMLKSMMEWAAH